jgi:saccharopine dehydrogenase-like NADP-dependent oxidoreductase
MQNILIIGAGKIGSLLTTLFLNCQDYQVTVVDVNFENADFKRVKAAFPQLSTVVIDVSDKNALTKFIKQQNFIAVISCLPFHRNILIAEVAKAHQLHYFDLTEDIHVTEEIKRLANNATTAFVPQCGLAPGLIGIIAHDLMQYFSTIDTVKLRTGALPRFSSNALQYALTWSTEGLINEYINSCIAIKDEKKILLPAMEDLESITIDGKHYEAFNTSGGLGSLAELYEHKVKNLTYKTIRYPGHCEKMRFLLEDLQLANHRQQLKTILETALPKTYDDVIVIYVSVTGIKDNEFIEKTFTKKILPQTIAGINWSAIQVATASSAAAVVDLVLTKKPAMKGLIMQEIFSLNEVMENRLNK